MKTLISSKTFIALAVALSVVAGMVSQAQEQPIPPPATENALPANIPPDSALAQIYKLVQSGVSVDVIKNYIANSPGAFNLDAETIIAFNDAGAPPEVLNAMMKHDKNFSVAPAPAAPAAAEVVATDTAPPSAPVTVEYLNTSLSPYGSWVEVEGYGRCWRPTVVVYDTSWQPYCDRGHWVYTDCGWYWQSEYSWGVAFHYGRWFRHSHFGWCWYPDTTWGPSWVSWRSGGDYCGWAPLPPHAEYRSGGGFFYRGASVSVGFDFGLSSDCFTFVSFDHFCDRHPRSYAADRHHVTQIYNQTTIINNYGDNNHVVVNNGVSVDRVRNASHRPIQPVAVAQLPTARREGWRGTGSRTTEHDASENNSNPQLRHGPVLRDHQNANAVANHNSTSSQPGSAVSSDNRQNRRDSGNRNSTSAQNANTQPGNAGNTTPGSPFVREQPRHVTPPVTSGGDSSSRQNDRFAGGGFQSQNNGRQTHDSITTPPANVPQRSTPQIDQHQDNAPAANADRWQQQRMEQRQNNGDNAPRSFTTPAESPSSHGAPQMQQQQQQHFTPAPSAPPVEHYQPQREQRIEQHEQRMEQRQSAPAPQPAPAPAASSQSQSSDHSDRNNRDRNH